MRFSQFKTKPLRGITMLPHRGLTTNYQPNLYIWKNCKNVLCHILFMFLVFLFYEDTEEFLCRLIVKLEIVS